MRSSAPLFATLILCLSGPAFLFAEPDPWWDAIDPSALPETGTPVEEVIDVLMGQLIESKGVAVSGKASSETLLRRVTLDLNGRIPTMAEAQAFSEDQKPSRWENTVDRLLQDPAFLRFQAHEWNWLLMDGERSDFEGYLTRAVEGGKSWDQIFSDVVTGISANEDLEGVDYFLRNRVKDLDKLTNDVSVRFFGVNISCAQCHDHPYVEGWTQDTYYGMASFFNRTFDNGGFVGEREYGLVSYKTTKGEERQPDLRFLGGTALKEPAPFEPTDEEKKAEKERLAKLKADKKAPPPAEYSRRERLIEAGLNEEAQGYFARAIVNQLWYRFFGRGLVMPLDQMHGSNVPSHPELLQWLALELETRDYELEPIIRGMLLSEAYQRESRAASGDRPDPSFFAVALPRVLSPRQYGVALKIATQDPSYLGADVSPEELQKRLERIEQQGESLANWFERPSGDTFAVAVDEALYFSNSEDARNQLLESGLVRALEQVATPSEQVRLAYLAILSRAPDAEEVSLMTSYLEARSDRPQEGLRQMVWALLTCTEARFNY